jgi:uncharacterized protein (DUF1778 family)
VRITRDVRDVLALRLSEGERAQIATAAGLQNMPLSSYVRCAALQASAVAVGKASVVLRRELPAPKRKLPVIDLAPERREHFVASSFAVDGDGCGAARMQVIGGGSSPLRPPANLPGSYAVAFAPTSASRLPIVCIFRRAVFSSSRFSVSNLATSSSPIALAVVTSPSYAAIS